MNLKRVIKWIGYIVAIIVVLYILIWGVLIYFLAGGDFKNSLIYLSEFQESGLYYGNENRKIANNVVAVHEVDNKLYYITLDGIGIFDENVSLLDAWNKDINKYNTFIPRIDAKETHFNVSLDELYPNISSLDESDRDIVDLSTGTIIGKYGSEHIYRNNAYYNFEFGKLTKIDFSQKAIYSYYSDNLDINRFSKNNTNDEKRESYSRNELNKTRTKDLEVLSDLLNQRFIVFDSFNKFSDFDKDTFEALAIYAIKNRKALQLGPLENQTLQQYLSK